MLTKEEVLERVDWIVERFHETAVAHNEEAILFLEGALEYLFDGDSGPLVSIHRAYLKYSSTATLTAATARRMHESRGLHLVVWNPELPADAEEEESEWLAAFQDYVGDRFIVEPYEPGPAPPRDIADPLPFSHFLKLMGKHLGVPISPTQVEIADAIESGSLKIGVTLPVDTVPPPGALALYGTSLD